jgi:hypothetical protein
MSYRQPRLRYTKLKKHTLSVPVLRTEYSTGILSAKNNYLTILSKK